MARVQAQKCCAAATSGEANQRFGKAKKLLYLRRFFPDVAYHQIVRECAMLRPKVKQEINTIANNRQGCVLPRTSEATKLFSEKAHHLSGLVGAEVSLSEFPGEYRVYPVGSQMMWHVDDSLYAVPQFELIYTVSNTSDSFTEWLDDNQHLHREWTEPNSLLIVQAKGLHHRVTPIKRGERSILKLIMTSTDQVLPAYHDYLSRAAYRKR